MPTKPHLQTHELSFVRDGYSCLLLPAHANASYFLSVILLRDILVCKANNLLTNQLRARGAYCSLIARGAASL